MIESRGEVDKRGRRGEEGNSLVIIGMTSVGRAFPAADRQWADFPSDTTN